MHTKKRFLVATFGAVVALTIQTPVSAYIVKARDEASHRYFGRSHPPSYVMEAFKDTGQRVLHADNRWDGWRAATGGALAVDDRGPDLRSGRFDSTLGEIDLHRFAEETHGQNGSGSSSGEGGEGAHASAIGGNGGRGYGGGGAGGPGGGGGGGYGSSGHGSGASEGNDGWSHNASFDGSDGQNGHGGGTDVFTSGSGGLLNQNWGGNWGSNGSGSDGSFCDNGHGGGVSGESVPEPTTLLFLAGGLAGLAARRRRSSTQGSSTAS